MKPASTNALDDEPLSRELRPSSRRPDLFIIGAAKAGTTSLYDYLRGHPEIYMSPIKETAFFSPDVRSPKNSGKYALDLDAYLGLFGPATTEKRLGEASPHYLYSRLAPGRIRRFQPRARIVATLRNPVEMAYALHWQRVTNGTEPIADFEHALAADERPDRGGAERRAEVESSGAYLERASYGAQLERWLSVFPREQCHVMILEEFIADQEREFSRLLEFLDVDTTYRPASFHARNASYRVRPSWKRFISSPPTRWARHRVAPALLGAARTGAIVREVKRLAGVRVRTARPPLDRELHRELQAKLAPDIERAGKLLGRDLRAVWR